LSDFLRLYTIPQQKQLSIINMKATTVLAVLACSAGAFAEANAVPKIKSYYGLCGFPGMTCHKTKRAAEAVAAALANAEPKIKSYYGLCGFPGMTCHKARRSLSAIEDTLTNMVDSVFARDADLGAEAKIKSYKSLCGYPGMTCARSAEPKIKSYYGLCGFPGMTCHKMKRGLDLVKEDQPEIFKSECFAEGGECHAVLAAQEAFHQAVRRDAEASPKFQWGPKYWHPKQNPRIKSPLSSCGYPGSTCSREAHAFARDVNSGKIDLEAAEAECNSPDGDCTVAQKALDELEVTLAQAVKDVYQLD
jgi:hypothetical protein